MPYHFWTQAWRAMLFYGLFTLLTGLAYPILVAVASKAIFPHQAQGSLIHKNGKVAGSVLIGQGFVSERYLWSRPSATAPLPYNAQASSGSNMGGSHPDLRRSYVERIAMLRKAHPGNHGPIPADLVCASASGLDPHISPAAAVWQLPRIAAARGMSQAQAQSLLAKCTAGRTWGFLGEPRVNVLQFNLALDEMQKQP